jgi:hypothetical protein
MASKTNPVAAVKTASTKKAKSFITGNLTVEFSNLKSADVKYKNPNHNVTVILTPDLNDKLKALAAELGATKINGLKKQTSEDGKTYETIKFKSTLSVKEGPSFQCFDAAAKATDSFPYRGDVIRCRVAPFVVDLDHSVSFALNGVQIIEKKPYSGSGFEAVEGGFVSGESEDPDTETAPEDETPF